MLDTSRWWTMMWPTNAISLLSFSRGLDAEQSFKLFRALRLTILNYVRELWFTLMDRRHAASNVYARALLRIDWTRVQRMLGRTANRRGRVMPDWTTVTRKPTYTIKSALERWEKAKRVNAVDGGQSQITGYFSKLRRQTMKRAGGAEVSGDDQPSTDSATSVATAARPAADTADQPAL